MATHSSILAWRILWTEEPGGLLSMGSQSRARQKRLSMHACIISIFLISSVIFIFVKTTFSLVCLLIFHKYFKSKVN